MKIKCSCSFFHNLTTPTPLPLTSIYLPTLPVIIILLPSLHAHLPRPQRLRQTPCQTRRSAPAIRFLGRVPPAFAIAGAHAHGAVSGRGRRCGFPAAAGSFRRRWRRGFRFCGGGAGAGAVDAVGGCGGRGCGSGAGDGLRWSWRGGGFGGVFCEVG